MSGDATGALSPEDWAELERVVEEGRKYGGRAVDEALANTEGNMSVGDMDGIFGAAITAEVAAWHLEKVADAEKRGAVKALRDFLASDYANRATDRDAPGYELAQECLTDFMFRIESGEVTL